MPAKAMQWAAAQWLPHSHSRARARQHRKPAMFFSKPNLDARVHIRDVIRAFEAATTNLKMEPACRPMVCNRD
jgi:hypothetical protein